MEDVIKAVVDGEDTLFLPFEVSESLAAVLTNQREWLDTVGAQPSGKKRYEMARQAGCLSAVAKGAAARAVKDDAIFIHHAELARKNGMIRISGLKTSINGIPNVDVRGVVFNRDAAGACSSQLEAKRQEEAS